MSTTIQIKRSSTASGVPLATDLAVGELAVNLADKRLFTKQSDGTVIELSTNPTDLDAATLRIDGVEITASAAELNRLDGFTGSTAELNLLDGLTATTIELNTLDGITASTAELNKLDGYTGSTAELNILDGVTATTAELNFVDGVTSNIQTQLNNKQPLDAQLTDVAGLTPADGSFIVGNGTNFVAESGNTAIASLGVTATAAELNTLDGITATTAELNTLDGITASTLELNYTDGVTSNIQTQLDGKATTAQGALADSAVQPDDNVSFGTGSFSGEISANGGIALGDNDKATFGASDDLQIFHDGSNSFIKDTGTGVLFVQGSGGVRVLGSDTSENLARFNENDSVQLYYDNSQKLATTSTGVDVTGTLSADGLTNAGSFVQAGALDHTSSGGLNIKAGLNNASISNSTDCYIGTHTSGGMGTTSGDMVLIPRSNANSAVQIVTGNGTPTKTATFSHNGDVSFYEDTGTTAKMVWSSSAESLGIGTSPSYPLHVSSTLGFPVLIERTNSADAGIRFKDSTTTNADSVRLGAKGNGLQILTGGSDSVLIDSSGNVGIGTASPSNRLHIYSSTASDVAITSSTSALRFVGTGGNNYIQSGTSLASNHAPLIFTGTNGVNERARIDSSGNLLVGTTSADYNSFAGVRVSQLGNLRATASNDSSLLLNRLSSDGSIAVFRKDGSTVGSIRSAAGLYTVYDSQGGTGYLGVAGTNAYAWDNSQIYPNTDANRSLGYSARRFNNLYLSGGVYLGGTGSANKLDDYEEGVWTPRLEQSTTNPSITYSSQSGTYTKVGRVVYASGHISWSSQSGGSGAFKLAGLPFNILNSGGAYPQLLCTDYGGIPFLNANDTTLGGYGLLGNSAVLLLVGRNDGSNSNSISTFNSSGFMYFNLTYQV